MSSERFDLAMLRRRVEELLAEGESGARVRESSAFDFASAGSTSMVLFGAGNLGRKTLSGLRNLGIEPLAFADSNVKLWNTTVDGLVVLSLKEAARLYRKTATFVITIWTGLGYDRMAQREALLRSLGCERVVPFTFLFWKYSDEFLPHYAADLPHNVHLQAEEVVKACELWSDEASRYEYLAQLRWRLLSDFESLPDPVQHTIYFPPDLCSVRDGETFVDCGAYNGDTVTSFLEQSRGMESRIFAFEPDPENFASLQRTVSALGEKCAITVQQCAISACKGTVSLCCASEASSITDGPSDVTVSCTTLDDVLSGEAATYIKMDIEGAEIDALRGATQTILRNRPVLAVCSYHRQDHLWKVPLLIRSFSEEYRFFLRPHLLEVWDLVCYAVPEQRLRTLEARGVESRISAVH